MLVINSPALVPLLLDDLRRGTERPIIAHRFHRWLIEAVHRLLERAATGNPAFNRRPDRRLHAEQITLRRVGPSS